MAWADLTEAAREGLNYCADTMKKLDGTPMYATGRIYADFICEQNGMEWLGRKLAAKRAARLAKLEAKCRAGRAGGCAA